MKAFIYLLKHYIARWRIHWKNRQHFSVKAYTASEAEFLPGALALQEKPLHPLPHVILWLIISFFLLALLWAFTGKVEIIATAGGKVIPGGKSKIIQPDETAIVSHIMVADGQFVHQGDALISLDDNIIQAEIKRIHSELISAITDKLRADILLAAIQAGKMPDIADYFPEELNSDQQEDARRWTDGQYQEFTSRIAQINAEIARTQAEETEAVSQMNKLITLMPITNQLTHDYQGLAQKHYLSRHDYLRQEQQRLDSQQQLVVQQAHVATLKAAQQQAQSQKQALIAQYTKSMLDLQQQAQSRITTQTMEQQKAREQLRRMTLRTPVNGTVQQLAIHTVGGVVTAAQPLMVIVPENDPVVVEALVENQDIGFIQPGLPVAVKVETFNYTKYGLVQGVVRSISRDAIDDQKKGLVYSVIIELNEKTIQSGDRVLELTPGMAVRAEIKTDQQRVIDYFLSPLKVYVSESLRER